MDFRYCAETTKPFGPKLNLRRMSRINIRPKTKLAETVQIVVFGAETETETEFRSVSTILSVFMSWYKIIQINDGLIG